MPLRDTLKKLAGHFSHHIDVLCLQEADAAAMRAAASRANPDRCSWHVLAYPGELSLPIHIVPITFPLSEPVNAALHDLRAAMQKEGFGLSASHIADLYEHRQGHMWLATLAEGQYLPIGQAVFLLEERAEQAAPIDAASPEPGALRLQQSAPRVGARRWWLHHVWIRPAYRCQRIFRHSIPYLREWHPNFAVRDPWPALARAFREHPGHIVDSTVQWF